MTQSGRLSTNELRIAHPVRLELAALIASENKLKFA